MTSIHYIEKKVLIKKIYFCSMEGKSSHYKICNYFYLNEFIYYNYMYNSFNSNNN